MSDLVTISSGALTAQIDPFGAELVSLKDEAGREYMSDGDPAFWTGRAPILFPIVGGLNGGTYRHEGRDYAMKQHGFARHSMFDCLEVVTHEPHAVFSMSDNDETRAKYPFLFGLTLQFLLNGNTLRIAAAVSTSRDQTLPFSFGFHPAFAWPLPDGGEKLDHSITFSEEEPQDVWRLDDGLLARSEASPIEGRRLALDPSLFEDDALIWKELASRKLTYGGSTGASLEIAFDKLPQLGIWQKPGANFICIEPWAGHADPEGFEGEFVDKPGIVLLEQERKIVFRMDVTVNPA